MSDTPRIAVIDDDESVRLALEGLLRSLGYAVRAFASAEAFLGSEIRDSSACIICDISMPGLSGFDLQSKLKETRIATPIILITAFADEALRARAEKSGAVCFLRKPFDAERLIDCLKKGLGE